MIAAGDRHKSMPGVGAIKQMDGSSPWRPPHVVQEPKVSNLSIGPIRNRSFRSAPANPRSPSSMIERNTK